MSYTRHLRKSLIHRVIIRFEEDEVVRIVRRDQIIRQIQMVIIINADALDFFDTIEVY